MSNRLRWLCRRGSLELDIILTRYLDQRYESAIESEKQLFEELLALEDSDLQHYFIAQEIPKDPILAQLVHTIRSIPPDRA